MVPLVMARSGYGQYENAEKKIQIKIRLSGIPQSGADLDLRAR